MLLNTVVISLSNILPLCIFLVLIILLSKTAKSNFNWLILSCIIGIFLSLAFVNTASFLSALFEYRGIEIITITLHCLLYLCIVYLILSSHSQNKVWQIILFVSSSLAVVINGHNYLVYMLGYWSQTQAINALLIGSILGTGVCISFSILFYFAVKSLSRKYGPLVLFSFLLMHTSGQMLPALHLGIQIDLISQQAVFWDTSMFVSEDSELGRLFKALFGYEAKPSLRDITIFMTCSILPLLFLYSNHKNLFRKTKKLVEDSI
ncbi:hypothetical protein [Pseudoalteromonas denitrificans]|uniref:High-affinity iron transporter n=1 Tax=Pseudoalteromonas denitrificans DSM 6059 TaxID=1123010 RepID=A0A1I1FIH8_9GAMM|nr:hypothetical protein [Pseudoalteromonas denitrificans]SFB96880.1 high-affinity iron transporter [Pseudoalteromonas denitrificans DSM 6059]